MDPTLHSAIIGTTQVNGIRELHSMENVATFDAGHADASIDPTTIHFVNDANEELLALFAANPLECPLFIPKTEGFGIMVDSRYAIDFSKMRKLSAIETEAEVFRLDGSVNFERSALGLSMQLLSDKGYLIDSDFGNVPYVNDNRKRALEQVAFELQSLVILKSIYDEIFKMVNIAGDILSGAAVLTIPAAIVAVANLATSLINLALLIKRITQLAIDNREVLLPPVRLHKAVNWYQYLKKGVEFLGKTLEMGDDLTELLQQLYLTPSKSDEVGLKTTIPTSDLDLILNIISNPGDGILRPEDYGYLLGEAIEMVKTKYNAKSAIKDGVYHLRWKGDPFWQNLPTYSVPDVLIEQALNNSNGFIEYNYNELTSRYLIEYSKDTTDYHTLTDVNNRMAEVIYDHPITDRKRSLLRGITDIQIPYALCVRKSGDPVLTMGFKKIADLVNTFQDEIQAIYEAYPGLSQIAAPIFEQLGVDNWNQDGALLVENHYFGTPKIVMLDETGRIPKDFTSHIGADALWINWHSWNSMAPGWKNSENLDDTNQKIIFREVRFPFGIKDWEKTISSSNCYVPGYGNGEFFNIRWKNADDFATADFFAYKTWAPNLTATLYKIAPVNVPLGNPNV